MKKPYSMQAKNGVGEIFIYDDIGDTFDGTTAKGFAKDLKALGKLNTLNIFINSPGGSVFEGVAIHNQLKRHQARKVVHIDGIAASIASVIAMAGDEISIALNGMMMIHEPWALTLGTAAEMRKMADSLDKVSGTILDTYASRTGGKTDQIAAMMAEETWMNAEEAVEMGFADTIGAEVQIAAMDLSKFRNVPKALARDVGVAKDLGIKPGDLLEETEDGLVPVRPVRTTVAEKTGNPVNEAIKIRAAKIAEYHEKHGIHRGAA